MLPTPAELRDLSHRLRQAACKATDIGTKRRLSEHALALAQVAEQIDQEIPNCDFVRGANITLYKRVLAQALDERTQSMVRSLLGEENQAIDKRQDEIRAWRMRAEELRSVADQFPLPSAQESLRRAAANYDTLADYVAAQLAGGARESYPRDEIG
jgi:hypothetical protein